uniref:hypothetical protein n=1 Tax=uncultured Psychrobacter sp. TaxID=259303 RepID=UPI002620B0ED|nr:hypothetical protein [uncultured Psychrobacter sp.]
MDEEPKKGYQLSSISEISGLIDKIERQMRPLSYNFEKINMIQDIARQYEHLDTARSTAAAASKVFEQLNPAAIAAMEAAKSANLAQSQFQNALASQNNIHKMLKNSQTNNNAKLIAEQAMKSIHDSYPYKDMQALSDQWRQSVEPYQSAWETVRKSMEASDFFKTARELQPQEFLGNSILAEYSTVFEQLESLRSLESFKAISRLKNFPFEDMARIDLDSTPDLEENLSETIVELDSEISGEISLVDDFNELSEEKRTVLLGLYQVYYYPIILNCLFILMWLQVFLDEKLDLTKNSFIFVERSKEKLSYISNVYRPNPSAMIDNLVVGGFLMLLAKSLGW